MDTTLAETYASRLSEPAVKHATRLCPPRFKLLSVGTLTNPPLCITEAEMREAFAIIDKGLEITDRAV